MRSPVIQYPRDMNDNIGIVTASEDKIMVLRSVKALSEASDLIYKSFSDYEQVAYIIICP